MAIPGIVKGGGGNFQKLVRLPRSPATVAGNPFGSRRPVCRFWLQGRCIRAPCPFLHSRDHTPPTAPPTHHPPTPPPHQQQWRRRPPLPNLVWRNPNTAPVPGNSPKPRGDGDKKRPIVTPDEDAPPATRPRRDDGKRGTVVTVGEDAPADSDRCLPPPSIDGEGAGERSHHNRGTTIAAGADAPEPEFLLPPAAARPTCDGDDDFGGRGTIVSDGEDAPADPDGYLPPPPSPGVDDEGVGERNDITTVADEEADAHKDGGDCAPLGGGIGGGSSFSFITSLGRHRQPVTGIALPPGSEKLFTGSADGAVRIWDCGSGRCVGVFDFGGPISCVITDGHWVFAGGHGGVRGWNVLTGAGLTLPGTAAQVCSIDTSTDMVFAGMADGSILAWKATLDTAAPAGLCFRPAASLRGHTSAVVSLCVGCDCTRLYAGSSDGTIRAWDAVTLRCIYTVSSAHDDAVTSLLCFRDYLLSSSLDGTVKAWAAVPKGGGEDNTGDGGGLSEVYVRQEGQGVRLLSGVHDGEGRDVLMCSLAADSAVRLYDLPSFAERGSIACGGQVGAMHTAQHGGFFFTSDTTGEVSVWRWS